MKLGLPDWYEDWTTDKGGISAVGFAWILSRPTAVQRLVLAFPPSCVVRVWKPCGCGTPVRPQQTEWGRTRIECASCRDTGRIQDHVGIVRSIIGGDTDHPTLRVIERPPLPNEQPQGIEHDPADLEVIGYWNGVTPEVVESILDATVVQQITSKEKVGRNDPCPCKSGKKHKHCCGSLVRRDDQKEKLQ